MKRLYQLCCGIDVHQATLTACVRVYTRGGKLSQEFRSFGATSDELLSLYDWLSMQRVSHVANGSDWGLLETGVLRAGAEPHRAASQSSRGQAAARAQDQRQ